MKRALRNIIVLIVGLAATLVLSVVLIFFVPSPYEVKRWVTYLPRYGTFDADEWANGSDFDRALMLDDLDERVLTYRAMTRAEVIDLLGEPDEDSGLRMRWETTAIGDDHPFSISVTFHPDENWEYSGEAEINESSVWPRAFVDDPFL